jgi:hypothetical protein
LIPIAGWANHNGSLKNDGLFAIIGNGRTQELALGFVSLFSARSKKHLPVVPIPGTYL